MRTKVSFFYWPPIAGAYTPKKDGYILHLSEHHEDSSPGAAKRIETHELETFEMVLLAKRYKFARPGVHEMSWGSKDYVHS
jgi:hypothetical protein